jgi:hypothetical protein
MASLGHREEGEGRRREEACTFGSVHAGPTDPLAALPFWDVYICGVRLFFGFKMFLEQ